MQSMQGDGTATSLPIGKFSLTRPTSANKGHNRSKNNKNDHDGTQSTSQPHGNGKCCKNTVLIAGDSMLSNFSERMLSRNYAINVIRI